jgi:RNA polymerase sigma factor (sigma-70 family)
MVRLYGRGFPADFIEDEGRDLFAEGQLDVIRLIDRGLDVYWPCGLLVHCAWRRTQRLVEKRTRNPRSVSLEALLEVVDERVSPEEEVISNDLGRSIRAAVAFLDSPDREIIQLTYFGEMTCTEAGRLLGWSSSKSQRIHQHALGKLRAFLEPRVPLRNAAPD